MSQASPLRLLRVILRRLGRCVLGYTLLFAAG